MEQLMKDHATVKYNFIGLNAISIIRKFSPLSLQDITVAHTLIVLNLWTVAFLKHIVICLFRPHLMVAIMVQTVWMKKSYKKNLEEATQVYIDRVQVASCCGSPVLLMN